MILGPRSHPDDESKRRWFLQDFSATTSANAGMELRTAVDCIQRMEREAWSCLGQIYASVLGANSP